MSEEIKTNENANKRKSYYRGRRNKSENKNVVEESVVAGPVSAQSRNNSNAGTEDSVGAGLSVSPKKQQR